MLDKNFDGKISLEELEQGFKEMGNPNYKLEAKRIFDETDLDKNGYIQL